MSDNGKEKGKRAYTMSEKALDQRRKASLVAREHATGPVTEEGKAASSRNNWKHGLYSAANKAWRDLGMGLVARPCKTTCQKYPCGLVEEELTKPGKDCLDKTAYVEAFNTLMDVLESGDVAAGHGMLAAHLAGALEVLQQLRDFIRENDVVVEQPLVGKSGEVVGHRYVANPALVHYSKLLSDLGINLPELMATPRSVSKLRDTEDGEDAIAAMFARIGTAFNGRRPVTIDGDSHD